MMRNDHIQDENIDRSVVAIAVILLAMLVVRMSCMLASPSQW